MTERETIARTEFIAVRPSGERIHAAIEIGKPYSVTYENGVTGGRCPVAMPGLFTRLADIEGVDTFQALLLAVQLVCSLLVDFAAKGGKFLDLQDEDEYERDWSHVFGSLWGASKDRRAE